MTEPTPVQRELFDTTSRTIIDPEGRSRTVDYFQVTDFGLYLARSGDNPDVSFVESWLIPDLGLRANVYHFRHDTDQRSDYSIDIVQVSRDGDTWTTEDLYVDLVSVTGLPVEVLDIDELAAATSAGLITAEDAETAIDATLTAVEGITRHGDDPMAWLTAEGIDLVWADPNDVQLAPPLAAPAGNYRPAGDLK